MPLRHHNRNTIETTNGCLARSSSTVRNFCVSSEKAAKSIQSIPKQLNLLLPLMRKIMYNEIIFSDAPALDNCAYVGPEAWLPADIQWPVDSHGQPLSHLIAIPATWL